MFAIITALQLMTMEPIELVQQMSLEEKVGQLFVVPGCPQRGDDHLQDLHYLFNTCHVGGLIFKQGTQKSYRDFLTSLKTAMPLIRLGDAEWGTAMRVSDAVKFPRNLTLGAIQDLSLIEQFGRQVGWECRQLGIDINLAPVADVNINPLNPIIGMRSFGDNPEKVAQLVSIVIEAIQKEGVLACAKHFPDHGDVTVDSHQDLPTTTLKSLETFKAAVQAKVGALLTAHLLIDKQVVTFSPELVHDLIRNQLQFPGLIITDGLNMKAISKYTQPGQAALDALKAGHDLLLYGDHLSEVVDKVLRVDVPQAISRIIQAVKEGEYEESLLNAHVVRIIETKQKLAQRPTVQEAPINTERAECLKQTLYDNAVTLISKESHLPITQNIQFTLLGGNAPVLQAALTPFVQAQGPHVVCVMKWDHEIKEQIKILNPNILIVMTSPYGLLDLPQPPTLIIGYENDPGAEESVRKVLFGEIKARGQLPIKLPVDKSGGQS
jgi:beta-N-acetylhexosaminidase